jgi:rhamnosyl/mannosyltransferase
MLGKMSTIVATSPNYALTSPVLNDRRHVDRVQVIPLGIDESSYPQDGEDAIIHSLGLSKDEHYFLFIGVLRYYKGLDYLLEASTRVNAKIVVAGTGPELQKLKRQADNLSLDQIIFAGEISDREKVSLLRYCRALVLPSHLRSEAFGMVLIEAGMYSKPMVSCEVGSGTSYANLNKKTGYVVSPGNSEKLAIAMNKLLANDTIAGQFGDVARQKYEEIFSGPALGKAYVELYKNTANN